MDITIDGVTELDSAELMAVGGGGLIADWKTYLLKEAVKNWGDIKDGIVDGWNGTYDG
ncbi:MAG TPA: hypothetical protein VFI96_08950 [Longimicrobiaceae bacterium]|nr:hypothetical protein [Longimicrobiaceae bacterium]